MDLRAVEDAVRLAAEQEVLPRFRQLEAGDIEEKSPGELVTVADRACETALSAMLRDIEDVPVVGEEAAAADPSIVQLLGREPAAWVVDPIDGTSNFAAGSPDYAVMVAYVERGEPQASWIWQPSHGLMATARRGAGAYLNGVAVTMPEPRPLEAATGVVKDRFLPQGVKQRVNQRISRLGARIDGSNCAGVDYPNLVRGEIDLLFYWRTLPWDHVPGVLFVSEAGGTAIRPNGEPFGRNEDENGLLVAHARSAGSILEALVGPY